MAYLFDIQRQIPATLRLLGAIVLMAASAAQATAQSNFFFQPDPSAPEAQRQWHTETNWLNPLNNDQFVPNAVFNESAIIDNGATAVLTVSSPNSGDTSVVTPGAVAIQNGGLDIRNTGELHVQQLPSQLGTSSGNLTVGTTGANTGSVLVNPGGSLEVDGALTVFANPENSVTLGGPSGSTASLSVDGTANLSGTTNVYPNADFAVEGSVSFANASVYNVEVAGVGSAGSISSNATASLNGSVHLNFSGFTPAAGNSWTILEADTINGGFDSVSSNGTFAFNETVTLSQVDLAGGRRGVNATIEEVLVLEVNRDSGNVSITHPGSSNITLDGYFIGSDAGLLSDNPSNWNSLTESGQLGGDWIETAQTVNNIGELKIGSDATFGSDVSLGNIFNPYAGNFGEGAEDLQFRYRRASDSAEFPAIVQYTGTAVNTLLLQVDPNGAGDAFLRNTSNTTVQIDLYEILSENGSLSPSGWNSLDEQNATQHQWLETDTSDSNLLAELNSQGFTTLEPGDALNLGPLYTGGTRDLEFNFLLMGEEESTEGAVLYEAFESAEADFNNDGAVDGRDFLAWQRGESPNPLSPSDLAAWQSSYGSGSLSGLSAVPEPSSLLLLLGFTGIGLLKPRRS